MSRRCPICNSKKTVYKKRIKEKTIRSYMECKSCGHSEVKRKRK